MIDEGVKFVLHVLDLKKEASDVTLLSHFGQKNKFKKKKSRKLKIEKQDGQAKVLQCKMGGWLVT